VSTVAEPDAERPKWANSHHGLNMACAVEHDGGIDRRGAWRLRPRRVTIGVMKTSILPNENVFERSVLGSVDGEGMKRSMTGGDDSIDACLRGSRCSAARHRGSEPFAGASQGGRGSFRRWNGFCGFQGFQDFIGLPTWGGRRFVRDRSKSMKRRCCPFG